MNPIHKSPVRQDSLENAKKIEEQITLMLENVLRDDEEDLDNLEINFNNSSCNLDMKNINNQSKLPGIYFTETTNVSTSEYGTPKILINDIPYATVNSQKINIEKMSSSPKFQPFMRTDKRSNTVNYMNSILINPTQTLINSPSQGKEFTYVQNTNPSVNVNNNSNLLKSKFNSIENYNYGSHSSTSTRYNKNF